jgi:hypothetical protein
MGNDPRPRGLEPQLEYHSQALHPLQGAVSVYFTKALPMTFIMKLERVCRQSRLYNLFQQVQDQESPALLTLYGFKINREEGCGSCETGDHTLEYWEFLNYSLEEHIGDRSKRGIQFTYHELWHVAQVVLEALSLLVRTGLLWEVHPALLEVTPEGKLKADWSDLRLNHSHLRFSRALEGYAPVEGPWWSPEERRALSQR